MRIIIIVIVTPAGVRCSGDVSFLMSFNRKWAVVTLHTHPHTHTYTNLYAFTFIFNFVFLHNLIVLFVFFLPFFSVRT